MPQVTDEVMEKQSLKEHMRDVREKRNFSEIGETLGDGDGREGQEVSEQVETSVNKCPRGGNEEEEEDEDYDDDDGGDGGEAEVQKYTSKRNGDCIGKGLADGRDSLTRAESFGHGEQALSSNASREFVHTAEHVDVSNTIYRNTLAGHAFPAKPVLLQGGPGGRGLLSAIAAFTNPGSSVGSCLEKGPMSSHSEHEIDFLDYEDPNSMYENPYSGSEEDFDDEYIRKLLIESVNHFMTSKSSLSLSSSSASFAKAPKERKAHFSYKKQTKETLSTAIACKKDFLYVDCGAFSTIPTEIISVILQFLPLRDLYKKVCKVNKAFFSLARKMRVLDYKVDLRFLSMHGHSSSVMLDGISKINEHALIQEISVGNHKFGELTMRKFLELVPNIRSIKFNEAKKVNFNHLQDLYRDKAPYLSAFQWTWAFELQESEVIAFFCNRGSTLKKFEVCHFYDSDEHFFRMTQTTATDNLLNELSRHCPELTHLSIRGKVQFSQEAIFNFVVKCQKLQNVEITKSHCFFLGLDPTKLPPAGCHRLRSCVATVNLTGYE